MEQNLYIREAKSIDTRDIYDWRNDRYVRTMSLSTAPIVWTLHKRWMESVLNDSSSFFFIFETSKFAEKIGAVRFDSIEERALVSILLAPSMRGRGLGIRCLSAGIAELRTHTKAINFLDAKIKAANTPSIRLFEACGFALVSEDKNLLNYTRAI